ncbi:uncharacterized protein [Brachyistius frenatus]|uniref:uncharacterized protein n=1 Tax=Brachyistius frenatus TaxID=100188 RepID=UPI0037E79795
MLCLWIILIFVHQGHSLISVTTGQLGEPVTFTCLVQDSDISFSRVKWYKQSIGDTLTLITTMMKTTANPTLAQGFSSNRFSANCTSDITTLTILTLIQEDEALYHCAVSTWNNEYWSGTYLSLKGNSQTSNYTVTQWPTASGPGRDSATLQCSILSDPEHMKCPGHHSVFWFRVGSDESHPDTIYTDGNRNNECDEKSDAQKSCVYRFSKNISSSDAGTYYCAVATCGRILFGNISKLHLGCMFSQEGSTFIFLLCAVLAISLIVIAVLIHAIKKNKSDSCKAAVGLQKKRVGQKHQQTDEDTWIYSAVIFTMMKAERNAVKDGKEEREKIYTAVKALGLD